MFAFDWSLVLARLCAFRQFSHEDRGTVDVCKFLSALRRRRRRRLRRKSLRKNYPARGSFSPSCLKVAVQILFVARVSLRWCRNFQFQKCCRDETAPTSNADFFVPAPMQFPVSRTFRASVRYQVNCKSILFFALRDIELEFRAAKLVSLKFSRSTCTRKRSKEGDPISDV